MVNYSLEMQQAAVSPVVRGLLRVQGTGPAQGKSVCNQEVNRVHLRPRDWSGCPSAPY